MLSEAKIGPELIESLSKGLRNLNNTTAKLSDVSDISLANSEFIANIKMHLIMLLNYLILIRKLLNY